MKKVILFLISVIFFNTVLTSGAVEQNSDSLFDVYFSFTSNGIYCENPVLEDGLGIEIYIDNKSDYEAEILIFTVFYYKSKIISSDFSKRIAEPEKMTGIEKELYFPAKEWDSVKLFILDYNSHKPLTDIVDVATLISKGTPTIITDAKQIKNSINSENDSDCFILMVKNDGYYDIKTTGTDMYAVLYGEDMLPVISTKGASTQNSWTYNLKKDIRYTIKLNSVQGAGSYILEINKLNNLITSLPTAHNIPLLSTGMTPVYWENEHIKLTEPENTAWYNYNTDENRWANVIMNDGSLYVWVPRYAYRIICDSNTNNSYSHQIETKYLKGLSNIAYDGTVCKTVSENPQDGDFIVSPGFTHGEDEYSGIWISKFQACVSDNEIPKFVPDSNILVNTKLKDILSTFIKTKNYYYLEDGADIHLLKNSEWSAAAYLAYSTCYNTAPTANRSHITGGGNYSENTNQSTTQNIYGIYDMSGAAEEFVAAYVKGSNVSEWESYDPKYYDIIDFSGDTVGQAIYETRSWCEDRNKNPSAVGIFRGYEGTTGGIEALGIFGYQTRSVSADKDKSWRAAIWIEGENPYNEIIANQTNELIYNADIILKNPYTGRMENATIIRSSDFHIDSPYLYSIVIKFIGVRRFTQTTYIKS